MKIIERIVESEGSPNQTNDLWLKASGDNVALKYFFNGEWKSITDGSSVSSDDVDRIISLTQSEYDGLSEKDSKSLYIIADTGKIALGSSMISGADGVGVQSVVQTTVSQEDGGTNVWTITLTNGQTSTLQVKNGNQGNSGYSGAVGELEVVNNLVDGGATSALSAEMGKTLNTNVSQLRSEVTKLEDAFDERPSANLFDKSQQQNLGYLNSSGGVSPDSSGNYIYSYLVPILPNKYYYLSGRNLTGSKIVRCLDSNSQPLKVLVASTGQERTNWNLPNEEGTDSVVNGQFKTPATAAYFQFNIKFNDAGTADNIMLSLVGDSYVPNMPTPTYVPFFSDFILKEGRLPADVLETLDELREANEDIVEVVTSPNLFDKLQGTNPGYINSNGGISPVSQAQEEDYRYSYYIPVLPNRYYYLSGRDSGNSRIVRCLDENFQPLKVLVASTGQERTGWNLPNEEGTDVAMNGQFKTPATAAYFQFNIRFGGVGTADQIMLLDLGDTYGVPVIPPYQPYGEKEYKVKKSALPDDVATKNMLSLLNGKTIRIFGGSIARLSKTWGGDAVMEALTGCTIQNDGLDGGGFCNGTTISGGVPTFAANSIPAHVNAAVAVNQPKFDIYILWASTNDVGQSVGTPQDYTYFDSYDVNKLLTQNGGINYCIKTLQTFAPEARIIVIGSMKYFDGGANIGSTIELLMQGQKDVARLQSCPFYSLWDNVGVNYYNKDRFFTWTVDEEGESRNDGTHPNKWAYRNIIAPKIAKQIALLW